MPAPSSRPANAPPYPRSQEKPPAPPPARRGAERPADLLTQAKVEQEILRISGQMTADLGTLETRAIRAAETEHAYKLANAQAYLRAKAAPGNGRGGVTTDAEADARAVQQVEAQMLARLTADALHEVTKEKLRTERSQMDALRTIAANLRALT